MVKRWSNLETVNITPQKEVSASKQSAANSSIKLVSVNKYNSNIFLVILTGWQHKWLQIDVKYSIFSKFKLKNCKNFSLFFSQLIVIDKNMYFQMKRNDKNP